MQTVRRACLSAAALVLVAACDRCGVLRQHEGHIEDGTAAIASARDDQQRAAGYDERARGYGEKARYLRAFKRITAAEYGRLFDQAVQDHAEAVRLDPKNVEKYVSRGLTYYDRGAPAPPDDWEPKDKLAVWKGLAKADFTRALELDGRHPLALDRRGMLNEQTGDYEAAIADYTAVMAIDSRLGRLRLADLYCERGGVRQGEKKYELAVADYEKSIALDPPADSCSCEPYWALASTCLAWGRYDKAWDAIHLTQAKGRWLDPELLERLKKASGRDR